MKRRILMAALPAIVLARVMVRAQETDPTGPQPVLPKEKLTIVTHDGVSHPFQVERALSQEQQTVGLMFRKEVPADGGMLFDWGQAEPSQMWMKNPLVPLDMVFVNADGTIRTIAENTVPRNLAVIDSHGPVRATIELQAGITAKLNIRVGDVVHQRLFGNAG